MWNSHVIRPSRNAQVPSGRPSVMYYVPALWGTSDQLCSVSDDEVEVCRTEAEFRSMIPCDSDVYDMCIDIISRNNLELPIDTASGLDMFRYLSCEIRNQI